MKVTQRLLAVLLIFAVVPAQAGWFSDDDDFVAVCKAKAIKIKTKVNIECATGDDDACAAKEAMENRQFDEEGCKAISIAHKKFAK